MDRPFSFEEALQPPEKTPGAFSFEEALRPPEPEPARSEEVSPDAPDFTRGTGNIVPQFKNVLGAAKAVTGIALNKLGADETGPRWAKEGLALMDEGTRETKTKPTDELTTAWEKGAGTVLTDWLPYQMGAGVGNLAETLGFMAIGAVTGAGVATIPGAVAGAVGRTLFKKKIVDAAQHLAEKGMEDVAKGFFEKEATKALAATGWKAGTVLGQAGQATMHGLGEVGSRAFEEQETNKKPREDIDLSTVLPAAAVHSVADYVSQRVALTALKPFTKPGMAAEKIAIENAKPLWRKIIERVTMLGVKETGPEEIQTIAERYGAHLSLTDAEAFKDYINTAGASFAMGVVPGVGGAAFHHTTQQRTNKPTDTFIKDEINRKQEAGEQLTAEEQKTLNAELTPGEEVTPPPPGATQEVDEMDSEAAHAAATSPEIETMQAEYDKRVKDIEENLTQAKAGVLGKKQHADNQIKKNKDLQEKIDAAKAKLVAEQKSATPTATPEQQATPGATPAAPTTIPVTAAANDEKLTPQLNKAPSLTNVASPGTVAANEGEQDANNPRPDAGATRDGTQVPEQPNRTEPAPSEGTAGTEPTSVDVAEDSQPATRNGAVNESPALNAEPGAPLASAIDQLDKGIDNAGKKQEEQAPTEDGNSSIVRDIKIAKPIKFVKGYKPTPHPSAENFLNQNSTYGETAPLTVEAGIEAAAVDHAFDMIDSASGAVLKVLKATAREKNRVEGYKKDDPNRYKAESPLKFMSFEDLLDLFVENNGSRTGFPTGGGARIKAAKNREQFVSSLTPEQRKQFNNAYDHAFKQTISTEVTERRETADNNKYAERERLARIEEQKAKEQEQLVGDAAEQVEEGQKTEQEERAEIDTFAQEQQAEETGVPIEETKEGEPKVKKAHVETTREKEEHARLQDAIATDGSIAHVLGTIEKNKEPIAGGVSHHLIKLLKNLGILDPTPGRISFGKVRDGHDGVFSPANSRIMPQGENGKYTGQRNLVETVLHEITHYFTDHVMDNPREYIASLPAEDRAAAQAAINRLRQNFMQAKVGLGDKFNIPTMKEFIAEAFSNREFQLALAGLDSKPLTLAEIEANAPAKPGYKPRAKDSLFARFVKAIAGMLGYGYPQKGVKFSQVMEDIASIISVPDPEAGIVGKEVSYSAAINAPPNILNPPAAKNVQTMIDRNRKGFMEGGWTGWKKRYQNIKVVIKNLQDFTDATNRTDFLNPDKINSLWTIFTGANSNATMYSKTYLAEPYAEINQSIAKINEILGKNTAETLSFLGQAMPLEHYVERSDTLFTVNAPIKQGKDGKLYKHGNEIYSPAQERERVMNLLRTRRMSKDQARALFAHVEKVVRENLDEHGYSPRTTEEGRMAGTAMSTDSRHESYSATGGLDWKDVDLLREQLAKLLEGNPALRKEYENIQKATQDINEATKHLNKMSNFWSRPVDNFVNAYGWKHYLPLKTSASDTKLKSLNLKYGSKPGGNNMHEIPKAMKGNAKLVENNPILQLLSDGSRAAGRAGKKDMTLAIRNMVNSSKKNPNGQNLINGEVVEHIEFPDRELNLDKYKADNRIFHYNEDGSVDIIEIKDQEMMDAIRSQYKDRNALVEALNMFTSALGQMHTRYNYAFAPMNYVRDIATNSFAISAELGPVEAARFYGAIASSITRNGLGKAYNVARLYEANDIAGINELAKKDPTVLQIAEFLNNNGMVAYVQGLTLKSNLKQLDKELGRSRMLQTKDQLDKVVDVWNNMFELSSRSAAYGVVKAHMLNKNIKKGMDNKIGPNGEASAADRAAQIEAAAYVKNLANFEQVGEHGRLMGALFMFFRPSATGAVRAIDALIPAFQSVDRAMRDMPKALRDDKAAVATFIKNHKAKQMNARVTMAALLGMGMGMYYMSALMAPDDDLGRNSVYNDNMNQWTRYWRMHLPDSLTEPLGMGKNVVFQLPWGFGLGAFASVGAQIAGTVSGRSTMKDLAKNTFLNIALDSFVPLPISRMDPEENPLNFAIDTAMPSFARPLVQFVLNKDGLGRTVYNEPYRRVVDAYTGGDNVPEIYKMAARALINFTDGAVDASPNSLYFFANSYADGVARIGESAYGFAGLAAGARDVNIKNDSLLFSSFFGAKGNIDNKEFASIQAQMTDLSTLLKRSKETNPELYMRRLENNPMEQMLVDKFNKDINGTLKKLQTEAKRVNAMPTDMFTPKERKDMLEQNRLMQRILKANFVEFYKGFDIKP